MKASAAKFLAIVALGILALNAPATLIYNNSVNDQTNRLSAVDNLWFGDEVILSTNYTDRFMTGFDFQYWGTNTSGLTVDVELRLNDGTLFNGYASPGTLVYQYFGLSLLDTARSTIIFNAADLDAYDGITDGGTLLTLNNITLAVRFHLGGGGTAGVDLYNPPTEGSGYLDNWIYNNGLSQWQLVTNNDFGTVNFGMTIQAVPEPTSFSLFILGSLMALGFGRFFGKRK